MDVRSRFDATDAAALERFTDELREIYADVLIGVAVTGEAASASYRAGRTPLETIVVVREVTPAVLRAARPSLRRWARARIPTPLFVDPIYLEGALDTFPLEFSEIADRHVALHGDEDPFAGLHIEPEALRLEVEQQLRGKLLHLWEAYLDGGDRRRNLARLMQEPLAGFELALRGLLRLGVSGDTAPPRPLPGGSELIAAVARELDLELPTLLRLESIRLDGGRVEDRDLDAVFEPFLAELRSIVRAIDARAPSVETIAASSDAS